MSEGARRLRGVFVGKAGLRAGFRLLLFLGITLAIGAVLGWTSERLFPVDESKGWTPGFLFEVETFGGLGILASIGASFVMRRLEHHRLADYGLPPTQAFGSFFWEGILWGLLSVTALVLLLRASGGLSFEGLAGSGASLLSSALFWAVTMTALGLSEEYLFRGYPLATLTSGMGFWPASSLLSLVFGALHYFGKPAETWIDGLNITLIGFFLCLTLRRTGSVWFAVGFHAAFDYAALVLFASPNSGNHSLPVEGHLLRVTFRGPGWLTGGPCGIEASAYACAVFVALFFLFDRRFRSIEFPPPPRPPAT
jgi:membrane protease YdiL (CAAX protease family)